jgi:Domain of unknown function (DUF6265)
MTPMSLFNRIPAHARRGAFALLFAATGALGQTPSVAEDPLAPLAWLDGCWRGSVNEREFREHWMPLRGGYLLGVSQTVMGGKSQGYEYLRIESRADGIYYVALPSSGKENTYKFIGRTVDTTNDRNDEIFTFENAALEFPRRIIYRRGTGGWLYAVVEGKVDGADRQVIYPMRRIDCGSGAIVNK